MATRKKKEQNLTSVVKGSHLTVTTLPDGKTVLEWDDDALLRDVRAAILKAESVLPVTESKPKSKKKDAQKSLTENKNTVKVTTRATKVKKTKK